MSRFNYKVRSGNGELSTGVVNAASLEEAGAILRGEGKFVVDLSPARESAAAAGRSTSSATTTTTSGSGGAVAGKRMRIRRDDVITFAHQMAVMIDTGVPMSEALHCIAQQCVNLNFRDVLDDVADRVNAGSDFSTALNQHPKVFPPVMISLMKASEASGTMGEMLDRVSSYLSREQAIVKKVRGALIYPCFMFLMLVAVTVFLLTFVLPKFAAIYQTRDSALPLPTQILMTLSNTMIHHWPWVVGAVAALVVAILMIRGTASGRRGLDYAKLHAPLLGPLFNKLYISRATRTMGTMIAAGVPILDMVHISRAVTANHFYEQLWDDVTDKLKHGSQLSDGLFASSLVPRSVSQMVYSGEKSGRLAPVMEKIADFTESDFEQQVKTVTQFIEPAMVAAMGLIVGFVAIALLLPIFTIGRVMAKG
ncbi:MAG: type II secretion system F family protein [Phycisphaeraceae bacterium]|nr:type II secretion system F family protein [Phycisphaeraceae bacterium]